VELFHISGRSASDGKELPGSRETFQFVFSTVLKFDARAGNEIGDGPGDKHFTWSRQG
jgi:hypothetical protein